jgi:hypothetical protein
MSRVLGDAGDRVAAEVLPLQREVVGERCELQLEVVARPEIIALALVDLAERGNDPRDSIVTLVLLRHAAERAGIDAVAVLDDMVGRASAGMRAVFASARDHRPADIASTVRAFGELGAAGQGRVIG